jgi:hypothetical protein
VASRCKVNGIRNVLSICLTRTPITTGISVFTAWQSKNLKPQSVQRYGGQIRLAIAPVEGKGGLDHKCLKPPFGYGASRGATIQSPVPHYENTACDVLSKGYAMVWPRRIMDSTNETQIQIQWIASKAS